MRAAWFVVAGSLLASALAGAGAADDPPPSALRVRLRIADDAAPGSSESVRDIQDLLREGDGGKNVVEAPPDSTPDLMLVITNRFAGLPGASRRGGELGPNRVSYTLRAVIVHDKRSIPLEGRDVVWRQAAVQVVRQLRDYAREQEGALLRGREDWPDVGFEFEPLTREHEQALGAKGGPVIVTAVAPDGPGARAGLRAGDAITKAAGRKLRNVGELARALYEAAPRAAVPLEVVRGGARETLTLTRP